MVGDGGHRFFGQFRILTILIILLQTLSCFARDLTVITVATKQTDGYRRFLRSCENAGVKVVTLGMGQEWQGGDMNYPGGGWKVNLLKEEMKKREDDEDLVMFTDSYDVVVAASKDAIIAQYDKFDADIVFGAENFCWPDASLKNQYPEVGIGMKYLNSGGFIGPANRLFKMLEDGGSVENLDDDQLFYTKIYINDELRTELKMTLDHKAELFQNLNGEQENVELQFAGNEPYVENLLYKSKPLVIHGNGPSKILLNNYGNYLAHSYDLENGCLECWENKLETENMVEMPKVVLAIFIERATPFMAEFWQKIEELKYDKSAIDLFIHNNIEFHQTEVAKFANDNTEKYHNIEVITHEEDVTEWHARNAAVQKCVDTKCDFLFVVDSDAHLDNPHVLTLLIEQNRGVVAPMLYRPYTAWSNFWGSLSSDGYYARSFDYMDIVNNDRRGLWNVPYITSCYLIAGSVIHNQDTKPSYVNKMLDPDMAFATNLRAKDVFMYVSNRLNFGHLVNNEAFPTSNLNNELWEMERNRYDWELRYLHPNYSKSLEADTKLEEPCPDVYWFPIFTETFCREFVAEAENYGRWSDGTNNDARLESGYEAVPTRDIHMNQINFDTEWMYILDFYVRPLQEHVFVGYFHRPPRSMMNFMVRYRPDEQPSLRPHHDSSTYTINVALNKVGVDYEVRLQLNDSYFMNPYFLFREEGVGS